jgi:hypothetical protein
MQISENKGPDLAAPSSMVRGPQAHWDKAEALTLRWDYKDLDYQP